MKSLWFKWNFYAPKVANYLLYSKFIFANLTSFLVCHCHMDRNSVLISTGHPVSPWLFLITIGLMIFFVVKLIARLIDNIMACLKILFWLSIVSLLISFYYAPEKTVILFHMTVDIFRYSISILAKFILWIAKQTSHPP